MWDIVLTDMLTDPRAIRNTVLASPFFRSILIDRLNFLDILTHLVHTNILTEADLLELRVICKEWRLAVDLFFDQMVGTRDTSITFKINGMDPISEAEEFLDDFQKTHLATRRNPFACRSIDITYQNSKAEGYTEANAQRSLNAIATILFYYGHHLRHVYINSLHDHLSYEQFHQLQRILPMTPNLTSIVVEILFMDFTDQQIPQAGFPVWPQIKLISVYDLPGPLFNALVYANRHVSILKIDAEDTDVSTYRELWSGNLWNVTSLTLVCVNMANLHQIFGGPAAKWQLEELWLYGRLLDDPVWILNTINRNWSSCVKRLTLYLHNGSPEMPMLRCDRVEKIVMFFNSYHDIEFLLGVANTLRRCEVCYEQELGTAIQARFEMDLEQRRIAQEQLMGERRARVEMVVERERKQVIKVMVFRHEPFRSNVWRVFPRLEMFEYVSNDNGIFQTWRHSREDWQEGWRMWGREQRWPERMLEPWEL